MTHKQVRKESMRVFQELATLLHNFQDCHDNILTYYQGIVAVWVLQYSVQNWSMANKILAVF